MVALVEAVRSWAVLQLGWLMHAYLSLCCKLDDSFDVILALLESRARKASHVHWSWIFAVQHRSILPHWRVKTGLCLSLCMLVATIIVCCSAAAVVRHAGGSCTPAYPVKLACNLFTGISLPRYSLLGASVGCAALLATVKGADWILSQSVQALCVNFDLCLMASTWHIAQLHFHSKVLPYIHPAELVT